MNSALWAAKTGLDAQESKMAVVANNLANVNTTGYKESRGVFQDLYYQNVRQVGGSTSQDTLSPSGLNLGTGVQMVATEKLYTQGSVNQTGNSLDVAINGRGFFQVLTPDGTLAYTRDGSFQTNAQGQVVTASGYVVQPAITIPQGAQSITIGNDGTVTVLAAGQTAPTTSARCSWRISSTRPGCSHWARTCWSLPHPAALRRLPTRDSRAWARCSRAPPRVPTSMWCRRWSA
jgi:flagellar basal-body rod protein FlgG